MKNGKLRQLESDQGQNWRFSSWESKKNVTKSIDTRGEVVRSDGRSFCIFLQIFPNVPRSKEDVLACRRILLLQFLTPKNKCPSIQEKCTTIERPAGQATSPLETIDFLRRRFLDTVAQEKI